MKQESGNTQRGPASRISFSRLVECARGGVIDRRKFTGLAAALLCVASVPAAHEPAKEAPAQLIRWTGSKRATGDTFILTAWIFPSRVEMHWDGFVENLIGVRVEDGTLKRSQQVKRDYTFKDEATVKAFGILAREAEQCDPGPPTVIGCGGVFTDAVVESPLGVAGRSIDFVSTDRPKAQCFKDIPFQILYREREKEEGVIPREIPAEDPLSQSIRDLAAELSRFGVCLAKLEAAYQAHGELPLAEMEALRVPMPMARALAIRDYRPNAVESTAKLLATVEAILADCLGPDHRAGFVPTGKEWGEGGMLLAVEEINFAPANSRCLLPHECLPLRIGKAEAPPMNLSMELEHVLLRFLGGLAFSGNTRALEMGRLTLSGQGDLNLGFSEEANIYRSFSRSKLNLDSSLEHPELRARLEYLNSKGIVRFLLGREPVEGKLPALIRIRNVNLYYEDLKRARIDFGQEKDRRVVELQFVEGRWMPMKSRTWQDYQMEKEKK